MAIPLKILILYGITCIFSYAFTKMNMMYLHEHILLHVNKIYFNLSSYHLINITQVLIFQVKKTRHDVSS